MKKIVLFSMIAAALFSCKNQDVVFDDYTETVYYPIQYPVRTLVLGESRLDNSIDLEHAFSVGVCVGGMYENKNDIAISYEVDETLVDSLSNVKVLPSAYYAIESENNVMIPAGSFNGNIRVNLTDAFFQDPEAHTGVYVLPLKITDASRGEILTGKVADGITDPSVHVAADWSVVPMNYTLFAVKYINLLHGDFFKRGVQVKDDTIVTKFETEDIEQGVVIKMTTAGEHKAVYTHTFNSTAYDVVLEFTEGDNGEHDVTFSAPEGAAYTVTGSGKCYEKTTQFAKDHGSWLTDPNNIGQEYPHTTLAVDYTIDGVAGSKFQMTDTLVFRNNDVIYEEFVPVLK